MDSSKATNLFLLILGVIFLPYGVYCFFAPGFLAEAAGVAGTTPTGLTEIRAMYGGLQSGFGLLLLAAARDPRLSLAGLAAIAFVLPGLASARLLGVVFEGGLSGYTIGALILEISSSAISLTLLRARLSSTRL